MFYFKTEKKYNISMKKIIYCPSCKKKMLGKAENNAKGTIWLWCKHCKKEIRIKLEPESQQ